MAGTDDATASVDLVLIPEPEAWLMLVRSLHGEPEAHVTRSKPRDPVPPEQWDVLPLYKAMPPHPDGERENLIDLAAMAICRALGDDPDETLYHHNGEIMEPYGPRWVAYRKEAEAAVDVVLAARISIARSP